MTPGGWHVRDLEVADRPGWDRLWADYLDYYGEALPAEVSDHVFSRLTDPGDGTMFGLVAVAADGALAGLANVVIHPNTWSTCLDAYLEDLTTDPDLRGQGVGHALIDALGERARRNGWRRVHWHTDRDNVRARRLYDDVATLTAYVRYVQPVVEGEAAS